MQFNYTELHLFLSSTTEQKDIRYNKNLKRIKILSQAGDYCLFYLMHALSITSNFLKAIALA